MQIRNKRSRPVTIATQPPIQVDAEGVVDVPDELGKSLLEQTDRWDAVKTTKPAKGEED